jgi:outer membrane protein OmpA-like peptidoglycan-associated protein
MGTPISRTILGAFAAGLLLCVAIPSPSPAQTALTFGTPGSQTEIEQPVARRALPTRDNTPLVTVDGRMMFFNSTRRGDRAWASLVQDSTRWDDDIYYRSRTATTDGRELWSEAVNLGPQINTSADDGVAAIGPNGTRLYIVSMRQGWEASGGPFYVSELAGTKVVSIEGMGGALSRFFTTRDRSRDFHIYGAAIDAYEQSFYFATTVRSKRGEQQIWVSRRVGETWGEPVNLGPAVNAPGGSYSPFIAADGKTLFFSSGRAGGHGGDDIYRATFDTSGMVHEVTNLGPTINSDGDEAFFSIPAAGDRVYLSSTRDGVESLVAAPLEPWMRPAGVALLSGTVVDAKTQEAVEATVRIEDLTTDSVVYVGRTSGFDDRYSTVLRPGTTYGISISAPGYVFTSTRYEIEDSIDYLELNRDFQLERMDVDESFTLHNIFFDYDSAELNRESTSELRRLGELLAGRERLRIEVGGHTDSVGTDEYNRDLSARRARAVREYLVSVCGIEPVRVMYKGHGFHQPVATNETEEGRKANRRVDFTIVSM